MIRVKKEKRFFFFLVILFQTLLVSVNNGIRITTIPVLVNRRFFENQRMLTRSRTTNMESTPLLRDTVVLGGVSLPYTGLHVFFVTLTI